ncbi:PAS domain-containing protein [Streptomyces sp. 351MFTsu5.1]|uniref:hybrid sensor histidine kinase/response regulator n=1 Tax=Streptomyces sp. 351MFTsu5.1 TaxID=1172180 RepID=UPI0003A5F2C9|nr:PAS domain-containing protein [Streptomyces sp. 351MFTsu5.1]
MSSRPSRGAARLAAILDALPDALVLVNANGTVVNANTIALEAFEAPGTALVGRGLLDLLPEFDSRLIPGSMRRPDHMDPRGRTKPTRMVARRTDGTEFPVEVTSANLENGQQAYDGYGYSGDELLMLVVRDLTGTVDTEAELARSQRQTEMILRAAAEGVVGTDTDGRIVLVNPAAAQILGYRASDLGGRELHDLILHSRADGTPFSYEESPLADTLRSGRKHRVRGQVLWSKKGEKVPVDLTTAPVRDGDQLVGAVLTFTDRRPYDALADEKSAAERAHAEELDRLEEEHASELTALRQKHITELEELQERHDEEIAAGEERYAALGEREKDRYEALAGRHDQLLTLLGRSLRGPLDELRRELSALAADDAGQLWPEANQVLHHLSAGYSRITHLIDNVLGYQRLDAGADAVVRTNVMLDAVVAAGVDGAVELIGPGRVQFAVHAPPIEAEVDAQRLATALAHLIADVAGVDATGNAPVSAGGYMDNTVVVAAALRGESVRIEVRGPYAGGDPVHEPIVRGIVRAHGGVLQTHEVPGMSGSAYVLEVPIGGGAGAVAVPGPAALEAAPAQATPMEAGSPEVAPGTDPGESSPAEGGGRRRARRASTDSFLDGDVPADVDESSAPTGRRRRRAAAEQEQAALALPAQASGEDADGGSGGTGRRRGRPAEGADGADAGDPGDAGVSEGAVVMAAEHAAGSAAVGSGLGGTVPPQGVPAPAGRRARRDGGEQHALPAALPAGGSAGPGQQPQGQLQIAGQPAPGDGTPQQDGRRRRALAAASERAAAQEAAPRSVFALPPADADRPAGADVNANADTNANTGAAGPVPAQGQPLVAGQLPGQAQVLGQVPAQGMVPGQVQTPAQVPQAPAPVPGPADGHGDDGRHDAVPHDQADDHTPPQPHPTTAPTGRRRRAVAQPPEPAGTPAQGMPAQAAAPGQAVPAGVPTTPAQQVPAAVPPVQYPGVPVQNATGQAGLVPQPVAAPASPVQAASPQAASPQAVSPQAAAPQAAPAQAAPAQPVLPQGVPGQPGLAQPGQPQPLPGQPLPAEAPQQQTPAQATPGAQPWLAAQDTPGAGVAVPPNQQTPQPVQTPEAGPATPPPGVALPADAAQAQQAQAQALQAQAQAQALQAQAQAQARAAQAQAQPLPAAAAAAAAAAAPVDPNSTQGRAISVRTLGQGVPFTRQAAQVQQQGAATPPPHQPGASGRRRKLGTRPDPAVATAPEQAARPHPAAEQTPASAQAAQAAQAPQPQPSLAGQSRLAHATEAAGRSYAIGAPDENAAEGPEPLDGPGGAVEIPDTPRPQPMDDELPPEPLDNPRRLLVWPAPDVTTQQALSDRGYRPVIVQSREEVDAQIAAFPAALFVDPLTGPITRTALQSLRQAAVASEVPIMVTAGLGQASREAAYGADPAVLLKALAPRDSEQHPPRVLLIEEHAEIALALTATLERRGMQVARAASDADAVTLAGQLRPNLVVMDLMQVHRRRAGIVDWLRANGQLNRTPLVVYTAAVDQADLPRLASGETVLFLAERSTSAEVQARIVDLLARIGTN